MGFYTTTSVTEKPHPETPSCAQKTASGKFFTYPIKTQYKNRHNSLKTNQEKPLPTQETASGVFYYKFRHYSAELGRWLGRDPIEERGGTNLYGFVGNEPVGRWDVLGLYNMIGELPHSSLDKNKDGISDWTQCCKGQSGVAEIADDFSNTCCENEIINIVVIVWDKKGLGGRGSHASIYHPGTKHGTYGNWPTGMMLDLTSNAGQGGGFKPENVYTYDPNKPINNGKINDVISLKACPKAAAKIKAAITNRLANQPGFGMGPEVPEAVGIKGTDNLPNCSECVVDILNEGGLEIPNTYWTPNDISNYFDPLGPLAPQGAAPWAPLGN